MDSPRPKRGSGPSCAGCPVVKGTLLESRHGAWLEDRTAGGAGLVEGVFLQIVGNAPAGGHAKAEGYVGEGPIAARLFEV